MDSQFSKILLEKYQNGDSQAAFEIHAFYAQRLFALVRMRIGKKLGTKVDPEDILQTAFQAFFEKADRNEIFWKKEGDLWRLLAAICINHVKREVEFFGAGKRNYTREQHDAFGDWMCLDGPSEKLSELVEAILENETPLTARVVKARLAGYTLHEIANQTRRSERTIRRVLQMLKAKLAAVSTLNVNTLLEHENGSGEPAAIEFFKADYADYDLLRMLGAGAFGKVYLAGEKRSGLLVAIKALRRSWIGNAKAEALFLNEARILASIEHPNIVKFLDAGPLPNGSWFIVMDYADGTAMDRILEHEVSVIDAMKWFKQICAALEEIHKCGATHGDLKPSNMIVCEGDLRLIDFGFSRQSKERSALFGGTAGFVAPELESSPNADIYAAGKTMEIILESSQNSFEDTELKRLRDVVTMAYHIDPAKRPDAVELLKNLQG